MLNPSRGGGRGEDWSDPVGFDIVKHVSFPTSGHLGNVNVLILGLLISVKERS